MIERLNRTYKTSYRPTNGFDNIDGANYELALWVTYYNFLRPHKHNNYKVLNDIEMLHGANNIPGKWQLLIFLRQQTILNLQNGEAANCSLILNLRERYQPPQSGIPLTDNQKELLHCCQRRRKSNCF